MSLYHDFNSFSRKKKVVMQKWEWSNRNCALNCTDIYKIDVLKTTNSFSHWRHAEIKGGRGGGVWIPLFWEHMILSNIIICTENTCDNYRCKTTQRRCHAPFCRPPCDLISEKILFIIVYLCIYYEHV